MFFPDGHQKFMRCATISFSIFLFVSGAGTNIEATKTSEREMSVHHKIPLVIVIFLVYELFTNHYFIIISKTLICLLRQVSRGLFTSIEEEMPPQIKFPTSKNLLKDPLL